MPQYIVVLSREVVCTYEAEVEVEAPDESTAGQMASKLAYDAKVQSWEEVNSDTQRVSVASVELAYDEDGDDGEDESEEDDEAE